jgi:hypothetical protein
MRHVLDIEPQQLFARPAQQAAKPIVDHAEPAVRRDLGKADRYLGEDRGQPPFALAQRCLSRGRFGGSRCKGALVELARKRRNDFIAPVEFPSSLRQLFAKVTFTRPPWKPGARRILRHLKTPGELVSNLTLYNSFEVNPGNAVPENSGRLDPPITSWSQASKTKEIKFRC